ncbi:MAG: hypothetical protein RBS17_04235 [Coriobacteriia bacterium]|nr:hypothetical protein [Coriobacteriia bacterium]
MKRTMITALSVVVLVFGVISYASAASTGSTTVNANVGQLLELTVIDTNIDLGQIDPENDGTGTVGLAAKSNKPATLSASIDANTFTTLTSTIGSASLTNLRGGNITAADNVTGTVDYNVDAGDSISGTISYSLVQ